MLMLNGQYEPMLVLVSLLVAIFASYTALSLAGRIRQAGGLSVVYWTAGGAFAMGSGIWAMHFIGMLAFRLPIPLGYDPWITLLSLLLPILVCGMGLWQLRHAEIGWQRLLASAILMGLGINAMHYTGMAAMRMQPGIRYDPALFALSVGIAIAASAGALWIAFRLKENRPRARTLRLAAAVVMGFAIAGMHYTGMAAASFPAGSVCLSATSGVSLNGLAILVTVAIAAVLTIALLVAIFDSRLEARNKSLAESRATAEERQRLFILEQEARHQAERLNTHKDQFLATLSHELRTPLNAVLGWSELLLHGARDEPTLRRGLEAIERNARAQIRLIEDLLDSSRILSGKLHLDRTAARPKDFIDAAVDTVRPSAEDKGIAITVDIALADEQVYVDTARMQQALWNILTNAVKFTEPGGSITVSAGLRDGADGRRVDIRISDTGMGIAPEFLPHVFERFRQADASTTRRHGGLGLGLSITRQLVELHEGSIAVESRGPGMGTTFTIGLPVRQRSAAWPAPASIPAIDQPHPRQHRGRESGTLLGCTVLVVDDEPDTLVLIEEALRPTRATVLTAASGTEAMTILRERAPDLLISDIGMPGMDGFALIRWVRTADDPRIQPIPAIALTAFSRYEDRMRTFEAGFNDYLSKPVSPDMLVHFVHALLARRSDRPQHPVRLNT